MLSDEACPDCYVDIGRSSGIPVTGEIHLCSVHREGRQTDRFADWSIFIRRDHEVPTSEGQTMPGAATPTKPVVHQRPAAMDRLQSKETKK